MADTTSDMATTTTTTTATATATPFSSLPTTPTPSAAEAAELRTMLEAIIPSVLEGGRIAARYGAGPSEALHVEAKADASPVTLADKEVNALLVRRLTALFPHAVVVAEEDEEGGAPRALTATQEAGDVFYVDPIDGTKEFIRCSGEWCVMVGMTRRGRPVLGLLYRASRGQLYLASSGGGAWLRQGGADVRLRNDAGETARGLVAVRSRATPPVGWAEDVEDFVVAAGRGRGGVRADGAKRAHGSFGLKMALVASGEADFYVTSGQGCLWDACAGHALAEEAGVVLAELAGAGGRGGAEGGLRLRGVEYEPARELKLPHTLVCLPRTLLPEFEAHLRARVGLGGGGGGGGRTSKI